MGIGSFTGWRDEPWRAGWHFATTDQQRWWDALSDEERQGVSTRAVLEDGATPADMAITAQILTYHDRVWLAVPSGAIVAIVVAVAAIGLASIWFDAGAAAGFLLAMFAVDFRRRWAQRRERWTRIDRLRAAARDAGIPASTTGPRSPS